jgi:serine/threonine-protein kinase
MVDIVPGQVVAGWRVQRELARGGMGVLFLAEHPRLPRVDVLKVLPSWLAQDERFRERFLREGRRVSALAHPHVVVVHDSGEHEGMLYLVMQYISGGDLRAQIADGPLPVDRALHLGGRSHRHSTQPTGRASCTVT